MIEAGDNAPDFTLPDQNGRQVRLSDFRCEPVVVYFYPKAEDAASDSCFHAGGVAGADQRTTTALRPAQQSRRSSPTRSHP